jgi:hypothetical protein
MAGWLRHWLLEKTFFASARSGEFIEPTQQGRRALLIRRGLQVAAAVVAFATAHLVFRHMRTLPACESIPWLRGVLVVLVCLPLVVGVYGVWLARAMLRHGQWPLPGTQVLWRRAVERGRRVCWRAGGLLATSALNVAVAFLGAYLLATSAIFGPPLPGSQCARAEAARASDSLENIR